MLADAGTTVSAKRPAPTPAHPSPTMSAPQDIPLAPPPGLDRPSLATAPEQLGMSPPFAPFSPAPLATSPLSWGQRRASLSSLSFLAGACAVGAALDFKPSAAERRSALAPSSPTLSTSVSSSLSALSSSLGALPEDASSPYLLRSFDSASLQRYQQPFKRRFSASWLAQAGPTTDPPARPQPAPTQTQTVQQPPAHLPASSSSSSSPPHSSRPPGTERERGRPRARTTGMRFTRPSPRGERFLMGQMDML